MRLLVAVLFSLSTVAAAVPAATAAPGQDQDPPTTAEGTPEDQDIIPEPNSGREPEEAGDRGGALQVAVLGLLVVVIGGGVYAVVRESRRKRADVAR